MTPIETLFAAHRIALEYRRQGNGAVVVFRFPDGARAECRAVDATAGPDPTVELEWTLAEPETA